MVEKYCRIALDIVFQLLAQLAALLLLYALALVYISLVDLSPVPFVTKLM